MKMSKKWTGVCAALAITALCGGAALAAVGDQNDPLVTKSYLDQTVIPNVIQQVEAKTAARQTQLEKSLDAKIEQYKKDIVSMGGGNGSSASYTLVTLTSGQSLRLEVGCEVMLRVGTATVNAATNPALIDVSTGGTINGGAALTKNHLYMATISDRSIKPTSATVKLLVRGGYTVA